jgi:hypothetical protein
MGQRAGAEAFHVAGQKHHLGAVLQQRVQYRSIELLWIGVGRSTQMAKRNAMALRPRERARAAIVADDQTHRCRQAILFASVHDRLQNRAGLGREDRYFFEHGACIAPRARRRLSL